MGQWVIMSEGGSKIRGCRYKINLFRYCDNANDWRWNSLSAVATYADGSQSPGGGAFTAVHNQLVGETKWAESLDLTIDVPCTQSILSVRYELIYSGVDGTPYYFTLTPSPADGITWDQDKWAWTPDDRPDGRHWRATRVVSVSCPGCDPLKVPPTLSFSYAGDPTPVLTISPVGPPSPDTEWYQIALDFPPIKEGAGAIGALTVQAICRCTTGGEVVAVNNPWGGQ